MAARSHSMPLWPGKKSAGGRRTANARATAMSPHAIRRGVVVVC